jgi:hypothetical protein
MNYMVLEGAERFWKNGSPSKQPLQSPAGKEGGKAQQKLARMEKPNIGDRKQQWLWVRKGATLQPGFGFPAIAAEVKRLGEKARRVVCPKPKLIDSRAYAKVVAESGKILSDGSWNWQGVIHW